MRLRSRTTTAAAALIATGLLLTACSGGDPAENSADDGGSQGSESWAGSVIPGDAEITVGEDDIDPSAITVECASEPAPVTMTITAPGGYTATTTQPEGGGPASITLDGPDSVSLTWDEGGVPEGAAADEEGDPEDGIQWGTTPTLTQGEHSLTKQDMYDSDATYEGDPDDLPDLVIDLADSTVSCEGGPQ